MRNIDPRDSQARRTIDEKFPEIPKDPRNLRLGISADGVEVNSGTRHHSVWLVLFFIYNLPPRLCMKRKFIMLSVLISGYPGNDIDVFFKLLVDDLHTLFETENFGESLVRTLLNVPGKTKDGMNARLDMAELRIKPELFARQEEEKTTLPPPGYTLTNAENTSFMKRFATSRKQISFQEQDKICMKVIKGHVRNRDRPEGCIAEETITKEEIKFFSKYHKTMKIIGIPTDKHVTNENEDEKPL
nr:hypothetical protein [Tanacetum cinerariifolium]